MPKELRVPHEASDTPQTYTAKMERVFKEHGLDLHRHEVEQLDDDFKLKQRVLKVKNTKYFVM